MHRRGLNAADSVSEKLLGCSVVNSANYEDGGGSKLRGAN